MDIWTVIHKAYDGDDASFTTSFVKAVDAQGALDIYNGMASLPKYQKYPYFWQRAELKNVQLIDEQIINK